MTAFLPPGLNGFITGFELLIYAEPYRRVSNVNQIARALNTYGAEGAGDAVTDAMRAARP